MIKTTRQRGSALLLTAVIGVIVLGLGAAFFLIVMGEGRTQDALSQGTQSLLVVEAGIVRAVHELRAGQDYDKNGTVGAVEGTFNSAPYLVTLADPGDGTFLLTGEAEKNGVRRAVEARVAQAPPIPAPGLNAQAALAILGQLGKKGKIDIHLKKPHDKGKDDDAVEPDEEEAWTSESTSPIAVDGHDSSGAKKGVPAVGIEDPTTYAKVADKVAHDIYHGKIPADVFVGTETFTIHSDKHGGIDVPSSLGPLQTGGGSLNYDNMNAIADQIETYVDNTLIPSADAIVAGKDARITGPVVYGSPTDPQTVVFDANKMTIEKGGSVTGYGDLIITGDATILDGGTLNWTGNVIVMGGNKDAVLKNQKGSLTIDGTALVLGTSAKKNTSKIVLHNDLDQTHQGNYTRIDGALLVWTGNNTDKAEKAEFKAKHGHFDINGFIGVYGDKTKFDVKIDDKKHQADGHFNVQGGVVVAVPGDDEKHKAKVHLHGDDILINYNSVNVERAINRLLALTGKLSDPVPATYQIISWREIVPPGMKLTKK